MLKLVIFTEELGAEAACEHSTAMIPDSSFALMANCISQWTRAGMCLQTPFAVAYPGLTEITYSTHQPKSSYILTSMSDSTVTSLGHTFRFSTLCTGWQTLKDIAKITESPVLLSTFTLVTFHKLIAWSFV
jgi:hypothetical protein